MKWYWKIPLVIVATLILLMGTRLALEPEEGPWPSADRSPGARDRIAQLAVASRVDFEHLAADLAGVDILLVGEEHRYREPTEFLTRLLEATRERRLVLLLELPNDQQEAVEEYVRTGGSAVFDAAVRDDKALPYASILAWAHAHQERLADVSAFDETRARIVLQRAVLRDTRNATMAEAILRARQAHPDALIVAYGGQLHMILAGRYRYDRPDRTPAGALLLAAGIPRQSIRSVLLSGDGKSPLAGIMPTGVVRTTGPIGVESFVWFIEYPVYGADTGRDLFDYYVNLGALTRARQGNLPAM